ncbi:MAG: hypothetical protein WCI26_02250 [Acidimicrobiales bacterium]
MHAFRSSKKGDRKGRAVEFLRCKSRDRSKPSVTFVESARRLAKKVVAGEASISKDTISRVGGRWPASVLVRYLVRYLIRYLKWYLNRYQVRPFIQ